MKKPSLKKKPQHAVDNTPAAAFDEVSGGGRRVQKRGNRNILLEH